MLWQEKKLGEKFVIIKNYQNYVLDHFWDVNIARMQDAFLFSFLTINQLCRYTKVGTKTTTKKGADHPQFKKS